MRTRKSAARGESVQSVERAGALLQAIAAGDQVGQSGAALAAVTGISKPAAYRILRALERIGFVAHNDVDGRFFNRHRRTRSRERTERERRTPVRRAR
jgi:DNA-binding IclR family transcriptional regulator